MHQGVDIALAIVEVDDPNFKDRQLKMEFEAPKAFGDKLEG